MREAIFTLLVGSTSDSRVQEQLATDGAIGQPFSIVVKSGERMAGRIVQAERRVGRKRGEVAQYRVELASVAATPQFYNAGDPTKRGSSQS